MKRPSLKRSKEPAPPQQAEAPKPPRNARLRGALGWPLRMLAKLLRPLGKPFVRLRGLQGRPRLIVWGLLVVIAVILVLQLRGGPDDEALVRQALLRYEDASRDKDYQTLCDDLLASSYVKQTASSGLPCEVALRTALEDVRNPTLSVLSVEVSGDRAAARVRGSAAGQVPGEANYTLIREDDSWRILPPRAGAAAP